jgi:tetratricopeptide (TPR) repeat protein
MTIMRRGIPAAILAAVLQQVPASAQNRYWQPDPAATRGDRYDPGANEGPKIGAASDALKSAMAAAQKKDWAAAKANLEEARRYPALSDFDRFEIEVMNGFVALNAGNYGTARESYRNVIASPYFGSQSLAEQTATLKNAMILSNEIGDYPTAAIYGEKLAEKGPLDDVAALALATAYFGDKDYAKAQHLAQDSIDMAARAGKPASDGALQIVAKAKTYLH